MDWNSEILQKSLAGKFFGHKLYYYPETGSTNDEACSLGIAGAPQGTVVIANAQNKGKGRMRRLWHSPANCNIYTSVILRPQMELPKTSWIPLTAGVAVAEVLDIYSPGKFKLKWPNDVLIGGKKVCGILTQMETSGDAIDFAVLGIGINVNMSREQFPRDIQEIATSLAIETGHEISRLELIISLYENLEKCYKKLMQKGFAPIREKWLKRSAMIGQTVQVIFKNETIEGEATGLDDNGSLILIAEGNKEIKVLAGDAMILKQARE
ncbi:MAG TPA: biotin--[acetyl-CoA-carboxylase] ligase [Smithella sp.]|nr:biotin--[acetyl-CoA-carboxylase] ligase [Smithella sp.]